MEEEAHPRGMDMWVHRQLLLRLVRVDASGHEELDIRDLAFRLSAHRGDQDRGYKNGFLFAFPFALWVGIL